MIDAAGDQGDLHDRGKIGEAHDVHAAAYLFDDPPTAAATERFLNSPDHLLIAYDDDRPVGMIIGVELARRRGCYGRWVVTDADNSAATTAQRQQRSAS